MSAMEGKEATLAWWQEAKFGMFVHWGLYAIPAGEWNGMVIEGASEWLINTAQIKQADYTPLFDQFRADEFDADEWFRVAKSAGMKYVVATSKHHEGFCLWDTEQTDYKATKTPFGRDALKELAEASQRADIPLGFYYSIMDWNHPDYERRREWDPRPELGEPDMDRYVAYIKAQIKELLSGEYGPVPILWFDGEWEEPWSHEHGRELYRYCQELSPSTLVNNRVDKGRADMDGYTKDDQDYGGDFGTPEQTVPETPPNEPWESCLTFNQSWGYKPSDQGYKDAPEIARLLQEINGKGGNLLLNVGPDERGVIPEECRRILAEVGRLRGV
ncbi:MAG: alpha-L-fucosidase [Fimbriimonadaceae bacterium]